MDRKLEVIRDDMEQTRAKLADKLGELENQVRETVSSASETVNSTVEGVKDVVSTVSETVETVTSTFNISKQVQEHPWVAMGVSVATGILVGQLLGGSPRPHPERQPREEPEPSPRPQGRLSQYFGSTVKPQQESQEEKSSTAELGSLLPDLDRIGNVALGSLGGLALGGVMNVVRDLIVRGLPSEWHQELRGVVDGITRELGGKPLPPLKKKDSSGQKESSSNQGKSTGEHQVSQERRHGKHGRGKSRNGDHSYPTSSNSG